MISAEDTWLQFDGLLAGQTAVAVGNGPSLNRMPREWMNGHALFVVNHWPWWTEQPFDFWVGLDWAHMEVAASIRDRPAFMPGRYWRKFEEGGLEHGHVHELLLRQRVGGVPWHPENGSSYSTTLLSAAQLAFEMGATTVVLAGFDCTWAPGKHVGNGVTGVPHWYDPKKKGGHMEMWDRQAGMLARHAASRGQRLVNVSNPTACTEVERAEWQTFAKERAT